MEREKCEFCNIDVKDKPSLKNHLNRNKKCLNLTDLRLGLETMKSNKKIVIPDSVPFGMYC